MSEIFISYARSDRPRAQVLASALTLEGWSVWWDRDIPPGRTFDDVIEEALTAAKCVIVLWSADSVRSEWVRNEASDAARRRILVPVLADAVTPPLEFRRIQSAALLDWEHLTANPDWSHLCRSLGTLVGRPPSSGCDEPKHAHRAITTEKDASRLDSSAYIPTIAANAAGRRPTSAIIAAGGLVVVAGVTWAMLSRPPANAPAGAEASPSALAPQPEPGREPAETPVVPPTSPAGNGVPVTAPLTNAGRPLRMQRDTTSAAPPPGRRAPDVASDAVLSGADSEAPIRADRAESAPIALPAKSISLVPNAAPSAVATVPARKIETASFDVTYTRGVFRESGRVTVGSDGLHYAEASGRSAVDATCDDVRHVQVPTVIVDAPQRMVELQMRDRVMRFTLVDTTARNRLVSVLSQTCGTR